MKDIIYNGFIISQISNGSFRIVRNDGSDKHSHLKNLNPCYKLIDNVNNHRIPKRCELYYLESHIRLTDNEEYKRKLQEYYEVKKNKGQKQVYYNPRKKKF